MPANCILQNNDLSDILNPIKNDLLLLEKELQTSFLKEHKDLNKILKHIPLQGGKRLRPAICLLIANAINSNINSANILKISKSIELLHIATLIHDDVLDSADKRHGLDTINTTLNNKIAVLCGDFILSKALKSLFEINNQEIIKTVASSIEELCEGELLQHIQYFKIIEQQEYIEKTKKKTANLFIAGAKAAAILSTTDLLIINNMENFALNFGIAFQIIDDIADFQTNVELAQKTSRLDLFNGIITIPVLFALQEYRNKGDFSLQKLIESNCKDKEDFYNAFNLIIKSNGLIESKQLAQLYIQNAINCLNNLSNTVYKTSLINLSKYILEKI